MLLDNLEYISIHNQTTDFPKHFRETFCISLIHEGVEQIDFENQSFFSEKGSISITNPYEIHSNPLVDLKNNLSFDTIYLSNDLMKYLLKGKNIQFINRKINDSKANQLFLELKNSIDTKDSKSIEFSLKRFIPELVQFSQPFERKYLEQNLNKFEEIIKYIEYNIDNKFCLEELAKMANINKYGFVKNFKASTGLTPMNYILMKKIFVCKNLMDVNTELTEVLLFLYYY